MWERTQVSKRANKLNFFKESVNFESFKGWQAFTEASSDIADSQTYLNQNLKSVKVKFVIDAKICEYFNLITLLVTLSVQDCQSVICTISVFEMTEFW